MSNIQQRAGVSAPGPNVRRYGLIFLSLIVALVVQVKYGNFITVSNTVTTLNNVATLAIAAIGAAGLLIAGRIDLSLAGELTLLSTAATVAAKHVGDTPWGTVTCVVVAIAGGWLLGLVNATLVKVLKISPLIVTIATGGIYAGIALAMTSGLSVSGVPSPIVDLGINQVAGIPLPLIIAAILFAIAAAYSVASCTGLRIYAIGGNEQGAALTGVPVSRIVGRLFCAQGALIGLVALIEIGQISAAVPTSDTSFEFNVLTAVLLGGVLFTGGGGRAVALLLGIITIGIVDAALVFVGVEQWWTLIVYGAMLLLALGADQVATHRQERRTRQVTNDDVALNDVAVEAANASPADEPKPEHNRTKTRPASTRSAADLDPLSVQQPIYSARGVQLRYGAVQALRGVDFDAVPGQITCLVGDNGAGKSSLVRVLSGVVKPTAGQLVLADEQMTFASPLEARRAGIETVHQDLAICPNLNVAHNIVLGTEPIRRHLLPVRDDRLALSEAKRRLDIIGATITDFTRPVQFLSGGQRQTIAIARVLHDQSRVAIFDEPTAALGVRQTEKVLSTIKAVAQSGVAVILVTHDIEAVLAVADRLVVLRLGRVSYAGPAHGVSEAELAQLMAGLPPERVFGAVSNG
ncbi:ATP-binding cassette domain-containing protein [Candidatus Protofrankia californiensis]|uniref:ATP-binding cassette domain-containing protein n=1 Tax=Candidatus Protofrankia californiensis TaxID=1839754 RepID=UPI0013EAF5D0|nr:ATP-binding cassette domain-containing protein [Candidatus Protofrankia californiensis]